MLTRDLNAEEVQARPTVRRKGMPVGRIDIESADDDDEDDRHDFDGDHGGVEVGTLVNSLDEDDGEDRDDHHRRKVHERAGTLQMTVVESPWADLHCLRQHDVQLCEHILEIARPSGGDSRAADGVLEDEIPANDPREQLTERRIGIGVCRARDRYHRCELGVAERCEDARDARDGVQDVP